MVETYVERVHTEHALLDIGEDIGALVIYTRAELRGKEIQVSRKGTNAAKMVHTAIWERRFNGRTMFAGIYPALPMGDYIIWTHPSCEVAIFGGSVAEVDLRDISDIYVPDPGHAHGYDQNAPGVCATASREATRDLLPPRYRDGRAVSAAPMGAAPLRYADDGQVAWDEMWTNFCDLALAGGPSHRGTLLEPVASEEVKANQDAYERVVAEIERGLRLVTGLPTVRSENLGWVGLQCTEGRGDGALVAASDCGGECVCAARRHRAVSACRSSLSPGTGDQERHYSGCQDPSLLDGTPPLVSRM